MAYLKSSDSLLALFNGMAKDGYVEPIPLTDTKVGFSVQRNYPEDIRFKPAKNAKGQDDSIAVIWVVYEDKKIEGKTRIPIRLRIAMMSKYRAEHWDYDFNDDDCPTKESLLESKKSLQPLELSLSDEYFYDKDYECLLDSSGKKINGVAVLNAMFDEHCNTVHFFKGMHHRSQRRFEDLTRRFLDFLIDAQVWILKNFFGRSLQERRDRSIFLDGYLPEDCRKSATESIELAGYKASKKTVVLFCTIVVIVCIFLLPAEESTYFGTLIRSEFLMLLHTIFALVIFDETLPWLVFKWMNALIRFRKWNFNRLLKKSQ